MVEQHLVVTRETIRRRFDDYVYLTYQNYAFFIKGAVIAAAALALIFIFSTPKLEFQGVRVVLWTASLGFSIVTIVTWTRGAVFTSYRSNPLDTVVPISMGVAEVTMFILVAPPITQAPENGWVYWYLAMSAHMALASLLTWNRLNQTHLEDYDGELKSTFDAYCKWVRDDRNSAIRAALATFVFFLVMNFWTPIFGKCVPFKSDLVFWMNVLAGVLVLVLAAKVVTDAYKQQDAIADLAKANAAVGETAA